MSLIKLNKVTKSYAEVGQKKKPIFSDLDFDIGREEKILVLGTSGSGKSTLLNLLSGIDYVDSGEVIINDINLSRISEEERTLFRRSNIGFVFQNFNLIPTLTVEENIMLPLEINSLMTNIHKSFAYDLLKQVGLYDRAKELPSKLSGGEQQRIAIVRALTHSPAVILADEPTGNLDKETADIIMNIFDTLTKQLGSTLVVVSHDESLSRFVDKVYRLENGLLVPHGLETVEYGQVRV